MSYGSLGPYSFYFHGGENGTIVYAIHGGSRTIPGSYGARYSRLYREGFLNKSHHNVDLTAEEVRRITMWLDLQSNELGAYRDVAAQRRGELVWPEYDVDPDNPQGVEKRTDKDAD